MKSKKNFLNMDERNLHIAYKIIAIMYFLTIFSLQIIILYRQFSLGQDVSEYEDFSFIMVVNSLFLISALLYFGAIPIRKLSIKTIVFFYLVFVLLGSIFTYAKYNIFQSPGLSFYQLLDKLFIIASIIGIIMGFWIILSYFGKRKIEKELK